jgi:hypothetical protein
VADPVVHDGVLAVGDVDVLRVMLPGTLGISASAVFVQMTEYFQSVFFS